MGAMGAFAFCTGNVAEDAATKDLNMVLSIGFALIQEDGEPCGRHTM